jgi:hypothetical protein
VRLGVVERSPLVDTQLVDKGILEGFATVYVRIEKVVLRTLPRLAQDPVGLGNLVEFRRVGLSRMIGVAGFREMVIGELKSLCVELGLTRNNA